jgi:hypothetical protein
MERGWTVGDDKDKITFKYVYPEDLCDLYVNGLFGGVTPRKEIYPHLYSERHPIPKGLSTVLKRTEHLVQKKKSKRAVMLLVLFKHQSLWI